MESGYKKVFIQRSDSLLSHLLLRSTSFTKFVSAYERFTMKIKGASILITTVVMAAVLSSPVSVACPSPMGSDHKAPTALAKQPANMAKEKLVKEKIAKPTPAAKN